MKSIIFVTGNQRKIKSAQQHLAEYKIEVQHSNIDLDEIQSDDFEKIAIHKAEQAYEIIEQPLFVNDAGWLFTALKGFPGPFMKFMNKWFEPEDFLALMSRHENKEIILRDCIVYIDQDGVKVFSSDHVCKMLDVAKGDDGIASDAVISSTKDGRSIAERANEPADAINKEITVWKEFGEWLSQK